MKRKPKLPPVRPTRLWSWTPDKRASRKQIREALRYARWEIDEIGTKSDTWYDSSCDISRQWRDKVRSSTLHALARQHLEYWRYRAFMPGAYGVANTGDRPAHKRWTEFA